MARVRSAADAVGESTGMRRAQLAVRRSRGGYLLGSVGWIGPSKLNSTPSRLAAAISASMLKVGMWSQSNRINTLTKRGP